MPPTDVVCKRYCWNQSNCDLLIGCRVFLGRKVFLDYVDEMSLTRATQHCPYIVLLDFKVESHACLPRWIILARFDLDKPSLVSPRARWEF